jgi:hypothetical protein
MKTDTLIAALAADNRIERPLPPLLLALLGPALVSAALVLHLTLGIRDDLLSALGNPVSLMRFVLTAALGGLSLRLALLLARPEGNRLARLWPLLLPLAVALGLWLWTFVSTPAEGRAMALVGKTMVGCLVTIPLLSVLPVAAILLSLRRGATSAPARAGLAAGLAGSSLAAMTYALHCTEDNPLFYVTWYGLAIACVTLATTGIGTKVLRW